jgi:hypothetical protein
MRDAGSFFQGGADAGDFLTHEAHGDQAEAGGALEYFADPGSGNEAQL